MRKYITRKELWIAIVKKYQSLKVINIDEGNAYVSRDKLFKIILDMKLEKSRHWNKEQNIQIKNEINERVMNKL